MSTKSKSNSTTRQDLSEAGREAKRKAIQERVQLRMKQQSKSAFQPSPRKSPLSPAGENTDPNFNSSGCVTPKSLPCAIPKSPNNSLARLPSNNAVACALLPTVTNSNIQKTPAQLQKEIQLRVQEQINAKKAAAKNNTQRLPLTPTNSNTASDQTASPKPGDILQERIALLAERQETIEEKVSEAKRRAEEKAAANKKAEAAQAEEEAAQAHKLEEDAAAANKATQKARQEEEADDDAKAKEAHCRPQVVACLIPEKSNTQTTRSLCPKAQWEKDGAVSCCKGCRTEFTFFNRRHHCRCCGKIFCAKCCPKEGTIFDDFRSCTECDKPAT